MTVKIIPDAAKQKPQQGELLALGNDKILENGTQVGVGAKLGDKIFSWKYSRLG